MGNENDSATALEKVITGLGLVALAAVLFAAGTEFDPLILWAVS